MFGRQPARQIGFQPCLALGQRLIIGSLVAFLSARHELTNRRKVDTRHPPLALFRKLHNFHALPRRAPAMPVSTAYSPRCRRGYMGREYHKKRRPVSGPSSSCLILTLHFQLSRGPKDRRCLSSNRSRCLLTCSRANFPFTGKLPRNAHKTPATIGIISRNEASLVGTGESIMARKPAVRSRSCTDPHMTQNMKMSR